MELPSPSTSRHLRTVRWLGLALIALATVASFPVAPQSTPGGACSSCCVLDSSCCPANDPTTQWLGRETGHNALDNPTCGEACGEFPLAPTNRTKGDRQPPDVISLESAVSEPR